MGTTEMFAELANNESQFTGKVNLFVALSPLTRVDNLTNGLLKNMAKAQFILEPIIKQFGMYELFG